MSGSEVHRVLTIGYGNRSREAFLDLVAKFGIDHIVDVRSKPESRHNPGFAHNALLQLAASHNLQYTFLGDRLGGIPADGHRSTDGKVDYTSIRRTAEFKNGLRRLTRLTARNHIALLCAELRPEQCHRCKLVGAALEEHDFLVAHIDERGELISQRDAIFRISQGQQRLDMTHAHASKSRKAYDK